MVTSCATSLVPRPFPPPVFDTHGGGNGLGTRLMRYRALTRSACLDLSEPSEKEYGGGSVEGTPAGLWSDCQSCALHRAAIRQNSRTAEEGESA